MNTESTLQQKPTLVNVIAWMTLSSGIVNIIWGLVASATALHTFIGFICTPFTILPTILGIFEVLYAAKLLSFPPQPVKPSTTIAILEIVVVIVSNIFSMVVGILALVFYNDLTVRDYFARLNGMPAPVAPVVPVVSTSVPKPAPRTTPEASVNSDLDGIVPAGSEANDTTDEQQPPASDADGETPKG